jgi:O-acetyl-ADP-ribose deacetylase (regulator of RNase III)
MQNEKTIGTTRIVTLRGDITEQDTDAIVNAANSSLMGGGGVDGAIHREREPELLASAYRNSLAVAQSKNIRTIAFPSISTGAYGYPVEKAAMIALTTVADFVKKNPFEEVRFVLFSESDFKTYSDVLSRLS